MTLLKSAELQGSHDNNEHSGFVPSRLNLNHSGREATFYRILKFTSGVLLSEVKKCVRLDEERKDLQHYKPDT